MPDSQQSQVIKTGRSGYIGWRGGLLAELALARFPELSIHKPKETCGYDILVVTSSGACFFVAVKAFSSKRLKVRRLEEINELRWTLKTHEVLRAHESPTPVFVFLIDADTDHGRYLRLDTVAIKKDPPDLLTIRFPRENRIDKKGIAKLLANLERSQARAVLQR
jgi:hypothetical protein